MSMSQPSSSYFILPTSDMEKSSLQRNQPAKTTKKSNYGSLRQDTSQTQQTAKIFIVNYEHKLVHGDTLLGISLKYNTPIENIKRANRLWSNDLTFLKDKLIVPLDRDKMKSLGLTELVTANSNSKEQANESKQGNETSEYKDFLNKFDSFINQSKMKLKSLENQNSNQAIADYLTNTQNRYSQQNDDNNNLFKDDDLFYKDDALFKTPPGNFKNESSSLSSASSSNISNGLQRSSNSNLTSNGHSSDIPDNYVTSPNRLSKFNGSNHNLISSTSGGSDRAKLARENLERLEREKDDLYEL